MFAQYFRSYGGRVYKYQPRPPAPVQVALQAVNLGIAYDPRIPNIKQDIINKRSNGRFILKRPMQKSSSPYAFKRPISR